MSNTTVKITDREYSAPEDLLVCPMLITQENG